jgi:DNA-binding response OmpR family regulator
MVVDEERSILDQVRRILLHEDILVITATDSRQALSQLLRENEETFDLILINTQMPGTTTQTALFSLKPTLKKLPPEPDDYLQKPFTREQLVEFVRRKL